MRSNRRESGSTRRASRRSINNNNNNNAIDRMPRVCLMIHLLSLLFFTTIISPAAAAVITHGTVKAYGYERRVRILDIYFFLSSIMLFNFPRENDVYLHHVTDKCRNGVLCCCGCCRRT